MTGSVTGKLVLYGGQEREVAFVIWALLHGFQTGSRFLHATCRRLPARHPGVAAPATAEPYKIVGFGDSLMAGYGLDAGRRLSRKAASSAPQAKGHDVVIANAGVSGDTTSGGLSRLDWSVPDGTGARHPRARRQRHAARHRPRHHREEPRRDDRAAEGAQHRRAARRHARRAQSRAGLPGGIRRDLSAACRKTRRAALSLLPRRRRRRPRLSARGRHAPQRRGHRPHGRAHRCRRSRS